MDDNEQETVAMSEVVEVLSAVTRIRATRDKPLPDDLSGDFDVWFDGGAIKYHTGATQYHLADGSTMSVLVVSWLHLSIDFGNGRSVSIRQHCDESDETAPASIL